MAKNDLSACTIPSARVDDLPHRSGPCSSIVIIGAGMAGMAAAYQLRQAGHNVIVLEARTRAGGRVRSARGEFAEGMHAEAGALFVPSDHEYLMKYIRLTGLEGSLVRVAPENLGGFHYLRGERYLHHGGTPERWNRDDTLTPTDWPGNLHDEEVGADLDALAELVLNRVEGGVGDVDDPCWPPAHLAESDEMNALDWLRSLGASPDAVELIRVAHLASYGDNGRNVSPLFFLQQWVDLRRLGTAGSYNVIEGGNDAVAQRLASLLSSVIDYGCEVTSIHQSGNGVQVTYSRRGVTTTVNADYVISAIPFACLSKVHISPALPAEKRAVVDELKGTSLSHLFIQCKRRVWRRPDGAGVIALTGTDTELASILRDATFNRPGARGVLDLFMVGPQADRMDALPDEQRLPAALETLEQMFPGISAVAEGAVYHSWNTEKYSRGAFVTYTTGQFTKLWPHVATAVGRIHFAGDQTAVKSGWQDGAISSGHRAAAAIWTVADK